MDKLEVLNKLILDLRAFLLVLDKETLTPFARAQKRSICDLLSTLEDPPTEDTEYMVMTCPSGEASSQMKIKEPADMDGLHPSVAHLSAAEEASFSSAPDWLLKGGSDPMMPSSFPVNLDGLWHERTELFDAVTGTTVEMGSDGSLYDSYGEEKDDEEEEDSVKDQTHYLAWTTSQPILHPVSESHLCGFLWRRRWLGQWSKQLFVIRSHTLLCYRCTGDLHPLLEMSLEGCHVLYRSKPRGKVPHQLKVLASSQTLVLGFHSWPQAQEWRKVIEEASVSGPSSFDKQDTSVESMHPLLQIVAAHPDNSPSVEATVSARPVGFLSVFMHCQWQMLWCRLEGGALQMSRDEASEAGPWHRLPLRDCEVHRGPDTHLAPRITVSRHGDKVAVLEASSEEDRQRWLILLQEGAAQCGPAPCSTFSGLRNHMLPTPNTRTADPLVEPQITSPPHPVYCNASAAQNSRSFAKREPEIWNQDNSADVLCQGRRMVMGFPNGALMKNVPWVREERWKTRSETNLLAVRQPPNTTSLRKTLTICSDRTQVVWLNLLRRASSASSSQKR